MWLNSHDPKWLNLKRPLTGRTNQFESFENSPPPLILWRLSNISKQTKGNSEKFTRKLSTQTQIDGHIASLEAHFKVLNPDFNLRAHLSTYTVANLRIFNPRVILKAAWRHQQSILFFAIVVKRARFASS